MGPVYWGGKIHYFANNSFSQAFHTVVEMEYKNTAEGVPFYCLGTR